ncbi:hypothetical protein EDD85DRAFT_962941 [Armillaria nabsnona]|nr:hypothetical protein EDD85DRAFT_962941 [Armillaria nabsnona]
MQDRDKWSDRKYRNELVAYEAKYDRLAYSSECTLNRLSDVTNNSLASDLDSPASYSRSPTPVSASIQNYAKTMDASKMREFDPRAKGLFLLTGLVFPSHVCITNMSSWYHHSEDRVGRTGRHTGDLEEVPPPLSYFAQSPATHCTRAGPLWREDQGVVFRAYEPHLATWTPAMSVDLLNTAMFSRSRVLNYFRSTVSPPRSCPPSADSGYLTDGMEDVFGGKKRNLGGTSSEHLDVVVVRPFAGGKLTGFEAPRQVHTASHPCSRFFVQEGSITKDVAELTVLLVYEL